MAIALVMMSVPVAVLVAGRTDARTEARLRLREGVVEPVEVAPGRPVEDVEFALVDVAADVLGVGADREVVLAVAVDVAHDGDVEAEVRVRLDLRGRQLVAHLLRRPVDERDLAGLGDAAHVLDVRGGEDVMDAVAREVGRVGQALGKARVGPGDGRVRPLRVVDRVRGRAEAGRNAEQERSDAVSRSNAGRRGRRRRWRSTLSAAGLPGRAGRTWHPVVGSVGRNLRSPTKPGEARGGACIPHAELKFAVRAAGPPIAREAAGEAGSEKPIRAKDHDLQAAHSRSHVVVSAAERHDTYVMTSEKVAKATRAAPLDVPGCLIRAPVANCDGFGVMRIVRFGVEPERAAALETGIAELREVVSTPPDRNHEHTELIPDGPEATRCRRGSSVGRADPYPAVVSYKPLRTEPVCESKNP